MDTAQASVTTLEAARGHPLVLFYTADDVQMAPDVADHFVYVLNGIGTCPTLDFMIESRGGATEVPVLIVELLRAHATEVDALVARFAMSAATATVLGANRIVMTSQAQLGPTDPARQHPLLPRPDPSGPPVALSVQDLRRSMDFVRRELGDGVSPEVMGQVITALFEKVHPMAIGAIEQSYELAKQVCRNNLATHMTDAKEIERIVDQLTDGYNAHSYPIMRNEARRLGLAVVDAEPWTDPIVALHDAANAFIAARESVTTSAPADYGAPFRRLHAAVIGSKRAAYCFSVRAAKKPSAKPEMADEWVAESAWLHVERTGP